MGTLESAETWWQAIAGGASALAVAVGSHLRVRDRVKTLEVKQVAAERRAETIAETHDTVIRLDGRMTMLENDLRASSETFARDMRRQNESQEKVLETLGKIERAFQIE